MLHDSFMHIKHFRLQSKTMCKSSYNAFKTAARQMVFLVVWFGYLSFLVLLMLIVNNKRWNEDKHSLLILDMNW